MDFHTRVYQKLSSSTYEKFLFAFVNPKIVS